MASNRVGKSLSGRVVLITGAASGLGAATAERLRAMGARLVLVDVDNAALTAQAKRLAGAEGAAAVVAINADVRDRAAMQGVVASAVDRFGGIHTVWANAGIAGFGPLAATDPAAWTRTIEVNLIGSFNTVRAGLPEVLKQRGHVAVTSSLAAFVNAPGLSAYCASKAGVEAMCNSLRVELAHHGVTVGAIHPSWVATPMVSEGEQYQSFRTLRACLPPPLRRDMPLAEAAERIARGIAERRDRVHLPRFVGLLRWLRTPLHTRVGERDVRRAMPDIERAYVSDVATHGVAGASMSDRAAGRLQPGTFTVVDSFQGSEPVRMAGRGGL